MIFIPKGTNYCSKEHKIPLQDIKFIYDLTFKNINGNIILKQKIFDTVLSIINNAKKYILIDMFLFNSHKGKINGNYRNLSSEIANKLINKKNEIPSIKIDFITDGINNIYGGDKCKEIELLKKAGVNVIITDLTKLRDSNLIYSFIWRIFFKWAGNSSKKGFFKHPFCKYGKKVTLRSYLYLLNFKANHRKIFLADNNKNITSIITSANFHDASSANSNVAIKITGNFYKDIYYTEKSVAYFSGKKLEKISFDFIENKILKKETANVQLLTEKKIKEKIILLIKKLVAGDKIYIAMFYLSERDIIKTLLLAAKRSVKIKIILDPNKDAFGHQKNGIPNRQVASELIKKSKGKIKIRWYNTNGEQFHTKLIFIETTNNYSHIILGSANLTRRNICNYNLETDIKIAVDSSAVIAQKVKTYFEKIWNNKKNNCFTVDYKNYKDESFFKMLIYRIQEYTGISTF